MALDTNPDDLVALPVTGRGGVALGTVFDVWVDDESERPAWAGIHGLDLGIGESVLPLGRARLIDGEVVVPYTVDQVRDAPPLADQEELGEADQEALLRHYGLLGSRPQPTTAPRAPEPAPEPAARGAADADALTVHEERVTVGVEPVQYTARLRKRIVTEQVSQQVPVTSEKARVVHEPVAGGGTAVELAEGSVEVPLHGDRVVVNKETVPVERVRLASEQVRTEEPVSVELAHEEVRVEGTETETEGDQGPGGTTGAESR